ncbi:MAG: NADH-quinone oxidoreductase subunit A [Candidatus Micrarchaeia archaeon]
MYAYVAIAVFAVVALAVPAAMLMFSWLIRPKPGVSEAQARNFESGEESISSRASTMHEYMHYFSMFLMVEFVSVMLLLWGISASSVGRQASLFILALPALALFFGWILLAVSQHRVRT